MSHMGSAGALRVGREGKAARSGTSKGSYAFTILWGLCGKARVWYCVAYGCKKKEISYNSYINSRRTNPHEYKHALPVQQRWAALICCGPWQPRIGKAQCPRETACAQSPAIVQTPVLQLIVIGSLPLAVQPPKPILLLAVKIKKEGKKEGEREGNK